MEFPADLKVIPIADDWFLAKIWYILFKEIIPAAPLALISIPPAV
jgi:hypothetical protein